MLPLLLACARTETPTDTVITDPWTPGQHLPSLQSGPRDQLDLRGLVHAHSVNSHDACDYDPRPGGVVDETCFTDFRRDVCRVRHDFVMLTDHRDYFTDVDFPETLLYREDLGDTLIRGGIANRLGCEAFDVTDAAPLVLAGAEAGTMPVGIEAHPPNASHVYGTPDAESIGILKDAGAVVLVQHTETWTPEELVELPLDGFEMYNVHANLFVNPAPAVSLLGRITARPEGLPQSDLVLALIVTEMPEYLATWGTVLSRGVQRVTTMGTDCHRNSIPQELPDGERGDSYRRMMGWYSNHLLVRPDADGSWNDLHLKEALRQGRLYGVFEFLGYAEGFDARAVTPDGAVVELGATFPLGSTLKVDVPSVRGLDPRAEAPVLTLRVLRAIEGGWDVIDEGSGPLDVVIDQPGAYRAEVRMQPKHLRGHLGDDADLADADFVWIYSSAIYAGGD